MLTDQNDIATSISAEVESILNKDIKDRILSMLVCPELIDCAWPYGDWEKSGLQIYPCWKVLVTPDNAGIVYCEHGFGPTYPWGLISLEDSPAEMGGDSSWHGSFLAAVADLFGTPFIERKADP